MKKTTVLREAVVIFIVLLFVGVSASSSIAFYATKNPQNDDLVEMTTQAYGFYDNGITTVKLTREQYQDLMLYLVEFRAQLNRTTTQGETAYIFREAIAELDTYGLLPVGLTLKQAQQIVTGMVQKKIFRSYQRLLVQIITSSQEDDSNTLCLIAGQTNRTLFENSGSTLFNKIQYSTDSPVLRTFSGIMYRYMTVRCSNNPFSLLNRMNLGYQSNVSNVTYYASGWVSTTGTNGIKRNEGNIQGTLSVEGTRYSPGIPETFSQFPAAVGFIGIKIGSGTMYPNIQEGKAYFYVGTALWTSITSQTPSDT